MQRGDGQPLGARAARQRFCDVLGRDAEQLVGSLGVDAVHPDDRDRVRGEIQRLVRREVEALTIDVRFLRPGADRVWARFTIWFVFDDDGEPLYFATDITDVTELRVARDAQEQTQRYFEALVQQSSDIVTVLERDGTRRSSSSAGERVLGWGPGSVPGNDIFSLVHPDDVDRAAEAFQLALADPDHEVEPVDLVCVNLYPFERTAARRGVSDREVTENIDIGGPTMIRAAAKNLEFAAPVVSPESYDAVLAELRAGDGRLSLSTRENLAAEAFAYTARYDTAIARWFAEPNSDEPSRRICVFRM